MKTISYNQTQRSHQSNVTCILSAQYLLSIIYIYCIIFIIETTMSTETQNQEVGINKDNTNTNLETSDDLYDEVFMNVSIFYIFICFLQYLLRHASYIINLRKFLIKY